MLCLILKMTCISARGGGGDIGEAAGTVRNGMTVVGIIIPVIPRGSRSYRLIGEIITEAADGMAVPGTLRISIIGTWTGIGAEATGLMNLAGDHPTPGDVHEVDPMNVMMVVPMVRMVARAVAQGSMKYF